MSNIQLHFVQCSFTRINNCLEEIAQVYQENDIVILLEDAVFAVYQQLPKQFKTLYLLATDQTCVPNTSDTSLVIEYIDYVKMAQLIAQADKVLNWR